MHFFMKCSKYGLLLSSYEVFSLKEFSLTYKENAHQILQK